VIDNKSSSLSMCMTCSGMSVPFFWCSMGQAIGNTEWASAQFLKVFINYSSKPTFDMLA